MNTVAIPLGVEFPRHLRPWHTCLPLTTFGDATRWRAVPGSVHSHLTEPRHVGRLARLYPSTSVESGTPVRPQHGIYTPRSAWVSDPAEESTAGLQIYEYAAYDFCWVNSVLL